MADSPWGPQLCATSTVGAAAMGYSFGRAKRPTTTMPTSTKRKAMTEDDLQPDSSMHGSYDPPSTTSHPQPNFARSNSFHKRRERRQRPASSTGFESLRGLSSSFHRDFTTDNTDANEADPKSSGSSRKAWFHRLSSISTSNTPSPTSSPGPNSPSVTFSHGSAAPMLPESPGGAPSPLPPNKLVKRSASQHGTLRMTSNPVLGRYGRVPTLRRPATSQQRTAALQHPTGFDDHAAAHHFASDIENTPPPRMSPRAVQESDEGPGSWPRYFEARATKLTKEAPAKHKKRHSGRPSTSTIKRICPNARHAPILVTATAIMSGSPDEELFTEAQQPSDDDTFFIDNSRPPTPSGLDTLFSPPDGDRPTTTPRADAEPQQTPRRSVSIGDMLGASPSAWVPRTRNSRARRQDRITLSSGKRYSSAPLAAAASPGASPSLVHANRRPPRRDITDPTIFSRDSHDHSLFPSSQQNRAPSITGRFSGLNISRPESSDSYGNLPPQADDVEDGALQALPPNVASSRHRLSLAASTLVDSDGDVRGSPSGDDLWDLQSETVFDSMRSGATVASGMQRMEALADDLSRSNQQMPQHTGAASEAPTTVDRKIMVDSRPTESKPGERKVPWAAAGISSRQDERVGPGYGALAEERSIDNDDEDDWDHDEEGMSFTDQLSSPQWGSGGEASKTNGQRGMKQNALGQSKVTLSNLFERPEPAEAHEAANWEGAENSNDRQVPGNRDSRPHGRRGTGGLHSRSQSVPVVADPNTMRDRVAATSRFGSWGLASKGVSEVWNEDFDFDESDMGRCEDEVQLNGGPKPSGTIMVVPEAIKARQANVIGQFGHVRNFGLLVEDLKRLKKVAVSKGITEGPSAELWKEADGIIDLASQDDDDPVQMGHQSPSSSDFGADPFDESPIASHHQHNGRRRSVLLLEDDIFGGATSTGAPAEPSAGARNSPNTPGTIDSTRMRSKLVNQASPVPSQLSHRLTPKPSMEDGEEDEVRSSPRVSSEVTSIKRIRTESNARHGSNQASPSTPATGSTSRVVGRIDQQEVSAVAKSVVESIHQRRSSSDPLLSNFSSGPPKKMPFDTAMLQDLVKHVEKLHGRLSAALREAGSASGSPSTSPKMSPASSLGQIMAESGTGSPGVSKMRMPRSQSGTNGLNSPIGGKENELGNHMPLMTVV
ncbi:MAG: hypothetical protein M1817_001589 [Caeruleum heppii]|nr:MAG: hypothetical protein M1817_001589 [Caeruleum heppii]